MIKKNLLLLSILVTISTCIAQVPTTGLLAYYNFETSYNSHDGNHNMSIDAGSSANSVSITTSGRVGSCLNLNAATGALSNTSLTTPITNSNFSVAFWIKRTGNNLAYSSSFEMFGSITHRNNAPLALQELGLYYNNAVDFLTRTVNPLPLNTWRHIAITYEKVTTSNAAILKVYEDGALGVTFNISTVSPTTAYYHKFNTKFVIGGGVDAAGTLQAVKCFKGHIDEFYIYNRFLSAAEVTQVMNSTTGVPTVSQGAPATGLLAYYNFETNFNSFDGNYNMNVDVYSAQNSVLRTAAGKVGSCLDVSAASGVLSNTRLANPLSSTSFTIAYWVKRTGNYLAYSSTFECFTAAFHRFNNSLASQEFGMLISGNPTNPITDLSTILPLNQWMHIAYVYDVNTTTLVRNLRLYENGALIRNIALGGSAATMNQLNNKFVIGGGTNANTTLHTDKFFRGHIDEFYVYNRSLTLSEISSVMNNSTAIILPTKLQIFTANLTNNTTQLNWVTTQEINTSHFDIEYSTNGNEFNKIGTVKALSNSNKEANYNIDYKVDNQPTHYYRLKMVDVDGKFEYSNIVKLTHKNLGFTIELYPTIVNDKATLSINATQKMKGDVVITTMHGQVVVSNKIDIYIGNQTHNLNIGNLPKGIYTLTLKTNNETKNVRLVRQ